MNQTHVAPDEIRVSSLKTNRWRCLRLAAISCSSPALIATYFLWSDHLPPSSSLSNDGVVEEDRHYLGVLSSLRRSIRFYQHHWLLVTSRSYSAVVEEDHNNLSAQSSLRRPIQVAYLYDLLPFPSHIYCPSLCFFSR